MSVDEPKKTYQEYFGNGADDHDLKRWGEILLARACAWAVGRLIAEEGITPVVGESWRKKFDPSEGEMRELLALVVDRCNAFIAAGTQPIILVGNSGARAALAPYRWGNQDWRCEPPEDITIRAGMPGARGAKGHINDVPVYDFDTPRGGCFVVPARMLRELKVEGVDAASALKIRPEPIGEDRVRFNFSWRAALS